MVCQNGDRISSIADWETKRRPELLKLFEDHIYGGLPDNQVTITTTKTKQWDVLDGKAIRKEIRLEFKKKNQKVVATLLLTLPISENPVPCFLGYNFNGNHTTTPDNQVSMTSSWLRKKNAGSNSNQSSEKDRGASSSRWPYAEVISKGYGIGTIYYGDIDPDFDDKFQNGIHPLFYNEGQAKPTKNQWGSIGAWAWALSRILDVLEQKGSGVDGERVAVIGHSRLGKTSLWAGATDQRFWITISNNSGCGGAALHRRKFGETVKVINTNFPHWFCDQFTEYNDNEAAIPVDQHMLMALMAPRPVYVASASKDLWADPKGEYLSLFHAGPIYELYGSQALPPEKPDPNEPVHVGSRAYHVRDGKHNITAYDWSQYVEFANKHLKK